MAFYHHPLTRNCHLPVCGISIGYPNKNGLAMCYIPHHLYRIIFHEDVNEAYADAYIPYHKFIVR